MGVMQHPIHRNHPDHDPLLISALAAGDLDASERTRATALVDACNACAQLHQDLIAIATATRTLPHVAAAPRDFRLSDAQASRLRRGSWLRTLLAPFSGARSAARPVAAAFTTLGVAGLLVATMLPGMLGSAASLAPERDGAVTGAAATAAPAPAAPGATAASGPGVVPVAGGQSAGPASTADANYGSKDSTVTQAPEVAVGGGSTSTPAFDFDAIGRLATAEPPSPLLVGSLALLAVGLLLFGLRYAGRRLR